MRSTRFYLIIIIVILQSCNKANPNEVIVRRFVEYLNRGENDRLEELLSDDFDRKSILLKKIKIDENEKRKSILIQKECLFIDELTFIDRNTIKTIEHIEDIYSDVLEIEMPRYEIEYFVANKKIISTTMNLDKANEEATLRKQIQYQEIKMSFAWWFSEKYPKYNNEDYLIENGLKKYLDEYSKLDSTELKKYKVNLYD